MLTSGKKKTSSLRDRRRRLASAIKATNPHVPTLSEPCMLTSWSVRMSPHSRVFHCGRSLSLRWTKMLVWQIDNPQFQLRHQICYLFSRLDNSESGCMLSDVNYMLAPACKWMHAPWANVNQSRMRVSSGWFWRPFLLTFLEIFQAISQVSDRKWQCL